MKIHTESLGTGRALVLVHGWGSSHATFDRLQPALADMTRAISVDLRGFGATGPVRGRHGISEMAQDLAELASETGPIIALGHSMGGSVVSHLALARPDLVAGLIVIDHAYGADEEECRGLPQRRRDLAALGSAAAVRDLSEAYSPTLPASDKEAIRKDLEASDGRVLLESFDGMYMTPDALGPLPQARLWLRNRPGPVLAIYSTEKAAAIEAAISPASTIRVAPCPGHFVHLEHEDWTVQTIREWLTATGLVAR